MKEIWKDIKDYKGLYQVSNIGRVKSLANRSNHKTEIIIKQSKVTGYMQVTLYKNSRRKMFKVHRLVAMAFIPNPLNKEQVNHIDGKKTNNAVENLEWNTVSENVKHAFCKELNSPLKGSSNKRSVKVLQIDTQSGNTINTYYGTREAERNTGIPHSNISSCCKKKVKTAGGYIWEYA